MEARRPLATAMARSTAMEIVEVLEQGAHSC